FSFFLFNCQRTETNKKPASNHKTKTINNKPKPAIAKAQIHGNQERNQLPPATPPPSLKSLIRTQTNNVNKQNTFFKE
ncbi:MAG: hypothetical protein ABJO38_00130, partial [Stappiaceae bacterium]